MFVCKKSSWPKLDFGLKEICVVNIFVIKRYRNPQLSPCKFRWDLVHGLVAKSEDLKIRREAYPDGEPEERRSRRQQGLDPVVVDLVEGEDSERQAVPRFEGLHSHHLDTLREYVSPEEAERNMEIVNANPLHHELHRQPRQRDASRKTHKVRNPLFTSASACLVCKYQHKRRRETLRYCRECCVADFTHWPSINRATGFAKFAPRRSSTLVYVRGNVLNIFTLIIYED